MTRAAGPACHARSTADFIFRRGVVSTIANEARLGRRPAHVKRQQVLTAGLPSYKGGRDDAGGRTRFDGHGGDGDGFVGFKNAAVRSHQIDGWQVFTARGLFQSRKIGSENGRDVSTDGSGTRALELSHLRQHIR